MALGKKYLTLFALTSLVIAGVAAVSGPQIRHKNLKILPQDISEEKLDSIMETYNKALGVKCAFCHTEVKGFTDSLDFALEENPMKENARKMMTMTIDINKKYFNYQKDIRPEYFNVVHCYTCHRGDAFPEF